MRWAPYRSVLALPHVRVLVLAMTLARVPVTASTIVLTLQVVLGLHRGYGAAGLAAAALTLGAGVGAPILGRLVDRRGLRPVLIAAIATQTVFWTVAPLLTYPALLVATLAGGLLAMPVFSVARQSLAALVPAQQRKPAYSLDSISVELSYMVGPAVGVLLATRISPALAMRTLGAAMLVVGLILIWLNPPTRGVGELATEGPPPRRRSWLRRPLLAVLAGGMAATLVLGGSDVASVAVLRHAGQLEWAGVVMAMWSLYSIGGGLFYGSMHRSIHPLVLAAVMGLATTLLFFAHDAVWICLLLIPAGALCAPSLAANADAVARLVPAQARGEAMGLQGSSLTAGLALGAPLAGVIADHAAPSWSFVVVGLAGAAVAVAALAAAGRSLKTGPPAHGGSPIQDQVEGGLSTPMPVGNPHAG